VPGNPQIALAHYPGHPQHQDGTPRPPRVKAVTEEEEAFLAIGDGARAWLIEAAAAGAALAGRFGDGDLLSIAGYQAAVPADGPVTVPDEAHSAQPGTAAWAGFGTGPGTPS
jgi:hypothetical protein